MKRSEQDIIDRLRECAGYALMDAARDTVLEAAKEIERLRGVIDVYVAVVRDSFEEIGKLRMECESLTSGSSAAG